MGFKEWYGKIIKAPKITGAALAACTLPIFYKGLEFLIDTPTNFTEEDQNKAVVNMFAPYAAYTLGWITCGALNSIDKRKNHPKRAISPKGIRKKRKTLQKLIEQQSQPTIQISEKKKISATIWDIILSIFTQPINPDKKAEKGRKTQNPIYSLDAATAYFTNAQYAKGMECIQDVFGYIDGKKPKITPLARFYTTLYGIAANCILAADPVNIDTYILSAAIASVTNPKKAWQHSKLGKRVADEYNLPWRPEMYAVDAMLATSQRRTDAEDRWADAIRIALETCESERLGETRNPTWILKELGNTIVLKGNNNRNALLQEKENTKKLEQILDDEATLPRPLHVTEKEHKGYYAYAMSYVEGETLQDKLEKQDFSAMPKVTTQLAKIHARYPTKNLQRESIDDKICAKLYAKELNIPKELANKILAHYAPVQRAVSENAIWAAVKDAHPENWLITEENKVGIIDFEINSLAPVTFDLANLLEYTESFTRQQKREYVLFYARELRKEGIKQASATLATAYQDDTKLMRAYHNSVIHRMLCLASAWSSPDRTRMQAYRKDAIYRAIRAINDLKKEDKNYYEKHQTDYQELEYALTHISRTL